MTCWEDRRRNNGGKAMVKEKESIERWNGGGERDWVSVKEDE